VRSRQRLRDAMLDAARELALGAGGWAGVRMGAVAHAVGVSRQRPHAEFGTKGALGQALILRETERFLTVERAAADPTVATRPSHPATTPSQSRAGSRPASTSPAADERVQSHSRRRPPADLLLDQTPTTRGSDGRIGSHAEDLASLSDT